MRANRSARHVLAALLTGLAVASAPAASMAETKADAPAASQPAPSGVQAGRQRILDDLFKRLEATKDADEARGITGAIERVWMRSGSDTADLLMERVSEAISKKNWRIAEGLLDKMVDIEPDWAEVWNKRATVRFFEDDYSGSMADLAHVLKLEPRHFTALVGMGVMLEKDELKGQALQVFRRALEINPQLEEIQRRVEKLQVEVEGRDI